MCRGGKLLDAVNSSFKIYAVQLVLDFAGIVDEITGHKIKLHCKAVLVLARPGVATANTAVRHVQRDNVVAVSAAEIAGLTVNAGRCHVGFEGGKVAFEQRAVRNGGNVVHPFWNPIFVGGGVTLRHIFSPRYVLFCVWPGRSRLAKNLHFNDNAKRE